MHNVPYVYSTQTVSCLVGKREIFVIKYTRDAMTSHYFSRYNESYYFLRSNSIFCHMFCKME
jgi:hypothetical protein